MRADRVKQLLKNGVYRAIGEAVSGVGAPDDGERALRVLMYHKVNDLWPNPTTVPTAVFDEQMRLLRELGYTPVALDAVRDYYLHGTPLPPGAVLITFDDGYRDNLENALPILQRYGYPELDRHLALHRSFTQSVARYSADLQASRAVLSVAVFRFLKNWLEGHILTEDMQYRPHLNSRGLR